MVGFRIVDDGIGLQWGCEKQRGGEGSEGYMTIE